MSEQPHSGADRPKPVDARHQQLADLEAEAHKLRTTLNGEELFGVNDVTAPNEGEDTWQSYIEQRPSDGVIREGDRLRSTEFGWFASAESYEAQKGSAQEYYDSLMERAGENEVTPNYEDMGHVQLAKEVAKAMLIGDRAGVEEIRSIAENNLMLEATEPGESKAKWTDEQYQEQMQLFEKYVQTFYEKARSSESEVQPEAAPEGVPVVEPGQEGASPESSSVDDASSETDPEAAADSSAAGAAEAEAASAGGDKEASETTDDATEQSETRDAESESEADSVEEVDTRSRLEKLKDALDGSYKNAFSPLYWYNRWQTANFMKDRTDIDKNYRRKQYMLAAGAGVVAGLLLARGVDINGLFDGANGATEVANGLGGAEGAVDTEPDLSVTPEDLDELIEEDADEQSEEQPVEEAPVIEALDSSLFNVPDYGGGIALLEGLGLSEAEATTAWTSMQSELLTRFPNEFYQEPGRMVLINNSGVLPAEVQQFITEKIAPYRG